MFNYKKEVEKLINWAHAYYVLDNPLATDDEYDVLYHNVLDYEKEHPNEIHPNSPTRRVGGVSEKFNKIKHKHRMWSQQDIFNLDGLKKWLEYILPFGPNIISNECKYDGLSLKLYYEQGKLVRAATRGDGFIGEDVTANAKVINSIPLTLPILIDMEINGEIVIHKTDFENLNKERSTKGLEIFANARNAAAGSMRLLNSNETAKRNLKFYPWEYIPYDDLLSTKDLIKIKSLFRTSEKAVDIINKNPNGFGISDLKLILNKMENIIEQYMNKRDSLPMNIDGIIFKIDDEAPNIRNKIGYTNKYPKWSCAYKFPAVEKTTRVVNIVNQIGRTGVVTPVAILTPTLIDGSTVERVTLHNYSEIEKKDIRINDQVTLIKSGDIIPKIIKVFKERRTGLEIKVVRPTKCPECGTILVINDNDIKCVNENCPSRIIRYIMFFAGRDYMSIDGLGESVATKLVKMNLIRDIRDLYALSKDKLELLDGFQDKKINNLLKSIEDSKGRELYKFVAALGISGFGKTVSKKVCDVYSYDIFRLNYDDLIKIDGVGEEIANNFINYMKNNKLYVMDLFSIVKPKDSGSIKGKLSNMDVVLTGSMHVGKDAVKDIIEKQGGNVKSSVSKTTDLVVYGNKPGSKLDRAKELGISIISYMDII